MSCEAWSLSFFALIRRGLLSLLLAVAVTLTPTRAPLAQSADNARYAAIVRTAGVTGD